MSPPKKECTGYPLWVNASQVSSNYLPNIRLLFSNDKQGSRENSRHREFRKLTGKLHLHSSEKEHFWWNYSTWWRDRPTQGSHQRDWWMLTFKSVCTCGERGAKKKSVSKYHKGQFALHDILPFKLILFGNFWFSLYFVPYFTYFMKEVHFADKHAYLITLWIPESQRKSKCTRCNLHLFRCCVVWIA